MFPRTLPTAVPSIAVLLCAGTLASAQQLRTHFPVAQVTPAHQKPNDMAQGVSRVYLKQEKTPAELPDVPVPQPIPQPLPQPTSAPVSAPTTSAPPPTIPVGAHPAMPNNICSECRGRCCFRERRCGPFSLRAQFRAPSTCPPPVGSSVVNTFEAQRISAMSEYFVIFQEDWIDETDMLNSSGERHLGGILRRLGQHGDAIRIEPIGHPEDPINSKRRARIIEILIAQGVPEVDAKNRVIVGRGRAEGLRYSDIEGLVTRSGGVGSFGSGAGGSGATGALQNIGGFGGLLGTGIGGFR